MTPLNDIVVPPFNCSSSRLQIADKQSAKLADRLYDHIRLREQPAGQPDSIFLIFHTDVFAAHLTRMVFARKHVNLAYPAAAATAADGNASAPELLHALEEILAAWTRELFVRIGNSYRERMTQDDTVKTS
jgi:hypothetical protein